MKYILTLILFLFISMLSISQSRDIPTIKSSIAEIEYSIDNKTGGWTVMPEITTDRLEVFCPEGKKQVTFHSDIDSIVFMIGPGDTAQFYILLNTKEKALTEVVGFNALPAKITASDKLYYLSLFWSEAKYNFVNMDRIGFSWDSLYLEYIPMVRQTANDYEFFRLMKQFAASLKDGHTQITDNGQFSHFQDYIPLTFKTFHNKIYLVNLRKNCGLDSTYVGAELLSVSSIPIDQYLRDSIFPFISASTSQHLWLQGVNKLHYDLIVKPFIASVRKTDDSIVTVRLARNGESTRTKNDEFWGHVPNYKGGLVDFDLMNNGIAYLSINRFNEYAISLISNHIAAINSSKALIIDLRKNGGGSTEVAWYLQSLLTSKDHFLNYAWQTRISEGVKKANGNWIEEYKDHYHDCALLKEAPDTIFIPDSVQRISVPAIILIGPYTFSAAEDFLVNLYEVPGRPLFVGQETGGSTGSPLVIPMPNDAYGRICTRRICYPYSGKAFVGAGVVPDITIQPGLRDYLNDQDATLIKAIELLNGK